MLVSFTEKKFLGLPLTQQHKKSAELLRVIYGQLLKKQPAETNITAYNELQKWMGLVFLTEVNLKSIADAYHAHLQNANVNFRENNLLPLVNTLDRREPLQAPLPIAIYLDNIRSAFNVGSILRTVEAMALGSVFFSARTPFIDHRQVQNTSMGTYQWVACRQDVALEQLPKPVIVMETSARAIPLDEFIFPEVFTLVLGNEEYGCSDVTLKQADYLIEIPLFGRKNSLNVANAFAIAAAEIQRQKRIINEK